MSWFPEIWNGVFPSMPCSLVVMEGTACTPSSRPSSLAPAAWPSFCGGTWAGNAPSSATEVQGLWPAPVWSLVSVRKKKKVYDNKLYFRLWLYVSSSFMPSAPSCATSAYTPREVDSQSRGQEQGWKTSSWGMNLNILVPPLLFLSSYLYIIDGMDVLHRVHHDFAYLREREGLVISNLTHTARWEYFKVKSLFGRQSWLSF